MRYLFRIGVAMIIAQTHALAFTTGLESDLKIERGELGSGEIFVECVIQNAPRKCFLDTGSSLSFVIYDSDTSALPRIGEVKKSGASGSTTLGDKVTVNSFKIGKTELGPIEIGRFRDVRHDLIGMDLFNDGVLTLDFCANHLTLGMVHIELPDKFVKLGKGHISFPIKYGGHSKLSAIFDTGAGLNSVDSKFVELNPAKFKFIQDVEAGYDINGHKVVMKLYRGQEFIVGSTLFPAQDFLSFDFGTLRDYLGVDTPFILGFNGMEKWQWKFDLKTYGFSVSVCNQVGQN